MTNAANPFSQVAATEYEIGFGADGLIPGNDRCQNRES